MQSCEIQLCFGSITRKFPGDKAEKEASDDYLENLGEVIRIRTLIFDEWHTDIINISDYLPRYTNKAVNFNCDDMGSDKATIMLFDYIVVVVIAFVFAVTTSNTISQRPCYRNSPRIRL